MDLMDKVRQVGENYELNKYKTLNKTVELDARLANDRLLATKLRLSQVSSLNDKLGKQLRLVQQQYRVQEKKLLLTETMLRQLVDSRAERSHHHHSTHKVAAPTAVPKTSRLARFRGRKGTAATSGQQEQQKQQVVNDDNNNDERLQNAAATATANQTNIVVRGQQETEAILSSGGGGSGGNTQASGTATTNDQSTGGGGGQVLVTNRKVSNSATQTQMSKTKTIISDLRQRLNLVASRAKGLRDNNEKVATIAVPQQPAQVEVKRSSLSDMAVQTSTAGMEDVGTDVEFDFDDSTCQVDEDYTREEEEEEEEGETEEEEEDEEDIDFDADEYDAYLMDEVDYVTMPDKHQVRRASLNIVNRGSGRRKSVSLNDIFGSSYIHEAPSGERIIISRGWPTTTTTTSTSKSSSKTKTTKTASKNNQSSSSKPSSKTKSSSSSNKTSSIIHNNTQQRRQSYLSHHNPALSGLVTVLTSGVADSASHFSRRRRSISEISIKQVRERRRRKHQQLNEEQKRSLLVEFLKTQAANEGAKLLAQHRILPSSPPPPVEFSGSTTKQQGRILVNKNNTNAINENVVQQAELKIKTSMPTSKQQMIATPVVKLDPHQSNNLSPPNQVNISNRQQRQQGNNKVSAIEPALKQQVGETTNYSDKERLVERIDSLKTKSSPLLQSQDINTVKAIEVKQDITASSRDRKTLKKPLVVQYDLPVHKGKPIALGSGVNF